MSLTASGPVGTTGNFSIVLLEVLLFGPFSFEVDGLNVVAENERHKNSFSFSHVGEDQVIILSSDV